MTTETMPAPAVPSEIDPIREMERLRETNRRWRRTAVGAGVAFAFLFVLSCVQFLGTFITCRLLHETRQEATRSRQDTLKALGDLKEAREDLKQTGKTLADYLALERAKIQFEMEEAGPRIAAIKAEMAVLDAAMEKSQMDPEPAAAAFKRRQQLAVELAELEGKLSRRKMNIAGLEKYQSGK